MLVAVHRSMPAHLRQLGLDAPLLEGEAMGVSDVEHALCEGAKYLSGRQMKVFDPRVGPAS
jgi:hypothetical protein